MKINLTINPKKTTAMILGAKYINRISTLFPELFLRVILLSIWVSIYLYQSLEFFHGTRR